jgi:poly(A) polymerase
MQPQIIPRTQHAISRNLISPEALKVLYRIKENGYLAFLCGGCVRDILLGREPKDFDLATNARPEELRKIFRNCRLVGRRFRLAHILFGQDHYIEVATFRALSDGKEPEVAAAGHHRLKVDSARTTDGIIVRDNVFGSPEEDALRRDFTVNALFYNIADFSLIDYVNGMADLESRLLRSIGDPRRRYVEDPVRMLRAIRFSATLGLNMESETFAAIAECRDYLALAAPARLFEEILKLFACDDTARVYALLKETGLLGVIFPDLAEWIASAPDAGDAITTKAFAYLDACRRDGRMLNTATQFAIVLGGLHEALAARLIAEGDHTEMGACMAAVEDQFARLRTRIMVPRSVSMDVAHIMALQSRFSDRRPGNVNRLIRRPSFEDALEYYAFKAHTSGAGHDDVIWWSTSDIPEPPPIVHHPRQGDSHSDQPRRAGARHSRRNSDKPHHPPAAT